MDRRQRVYVMTCAVMMAYCVAFVIATRIAIPLWWYLPLERQWSFGFRPSGLAMDWYGRTLFAIGAAVVVLALTAIITSRRSALSERAARGWGIAVAVSIVAAISAVVRLH